jgi:hypothetical protein
VSLCENNASFAISSRPAHSPFAQSITVLHLPCTHPPHPITPPNTRYPTTVATLSRRARDIIAAAFEASADGGATNPLLPSRLHDFGFRGCTSLEQSVLGGCAHLINFDGTDTMSAAYYAQVWLQLSEHGVLPPVSMNEGCVFFNAAFPW